MLTRARFPGADDLHNVVTKLVKTGYHRVWVVKEKKPIGEFGASFPRLLGCSCIEFVACHFWSTTREVFFDGWYPASVGVLSLTDVFKKLVTDEKKEDCTIL